MCLRSSAFPRFNLLHLETWHSEKRDSSCSVGRTETLGKCWKSSLRSLFTYLLLPQSHETLRETPFVGCVVFLM